MRRGAGSTRRVPTRWRILRPFVAVVIAVAFLAPAPWSWALAELGVPETPSAASAAWNPTGVSDSTAPPFPGSGVPLLPAPQAFRIVATPQQPEPSPIALDRAFVYPDLYNLATNGTGEAELAQGSPGAPVLATVNFSAVGVRNAGVGGYPEVQYGVKPWCFHPPCASPTVDHALPLPVAVSDLPAVAAYAAYSTGAIGGGTRGAFDVAYDLWMTRTPAPPDSSAGDVELMLWLDHQGDGILPGTPVGSVDLPTFVGSAWSWLRWDLYVQYPDPAGAGGHWTVVYLVLDPARDAGSVGIALTSAIGVVSSQLTQRYPGSWGGRPGAPGGSLGSLYLDDIELGTEFRPAGESGPVQYRWTVSTFCLQIGAGASGPPGPASDPVCLPATTGSGQGVTSGPFAVAGAILPAAAFVAVRPMVASRGRLSSGWRRSRPATGRGRGP